MKKTLVILLMLALLCLPARAEGTGEAEALRKQALDAGMQLPDPAEGEALYLGAADVHFTGKTKLFLAFLASPNRCSIRAAVLYGQAIEVPRPGRDPWLINNQLTLKEDLWIPLDLGGPTSIVIDEDLYTAIARLTVDEDSARCTEVLSGHFRSFEAGADSDWNATGSITLLNLTGETAMDAVPPPTVEQAVAAGMQLPEPAEGEALYLGAANVSQAGALYAAFALSEDGSQVRGLTVFIRDLDVEYRLGNSKVNTTSASQTSTINGALAVGEKIDVGAVALEGFALDDDGAEAVLKYTFQADDGVEYPFDFARVRFARVK